jgi:NADH-quinone oxidoreductase subunit N
MSDLSLLALSPFLALAAAAVVVLLVSTFTRSHIVSARLTVAGLVAAFTCLLLVAASDDRRATSLLRLDNFALYFIGLLIVVTLFVIVVSYGYLDRTERRHADFYVLLTLATLGATTLAASAHFASLFLGLEVLSVSLYGLIAYAERRLQVVEAGFKYLVLGGTTSAFLLFGMALVYTVTGTMTLPGLVGAAQGLSGWEVATYAVGLVLIFAGVGFKLALVPFHLWTPDVYQGSAAPVTAFLATVSKGAVFAVLAHFLAVLDPKSHGALFVVFAIVGYASMLVGNLLALFQENIKRLLAYSSIAHLGYLVVALVAGGESGRLAIAFYLTVYSLALVAALGVVALLSRGDEEAELLDEYRGLGRRRPLPAIVLSVSVLSLAGVPLTAGFMGKFFIVRAGAAASQWGLLIVLALTSAMSLYYYLRVVIVMFRQDEAPSVAGRSPFWGAAPDRLATIGLALLAAITIWLGVYPAPLLHLIEKVAAVLG